MKLKHRFRFMCICILSLFLPVIVQNAGASELTKKQINIITLEESVSEALSKFSSIKVKKEAMEEAAYAQKKARADFLPSLSTTYGYTRISDVPRLENVNLGAGPPIPKIETATEDNYQWKVTAKQPLFTGFAIVSAYKLARLGIDLSRFELEMEKLDIALKVKEVYFSVLSADKSLDVAKRAVTLLESTVNEAQDYFNAGIIPVNDLLKAEVELGSARHNLTKAQNATRITRSAFNTVLARPINSPVALEDILVYKPVVTDFDWSLEQALKNRPEIKILDITICQADQQIRLARSNYYPEIALSSDYIKEGDEPDVSGSNFHVSDSWQTMVGVSWKFWHWGETVYSVGGEKSRKKQLIHSKAGIEDGIRFQVKEAVLYLEEAEKNIPTTKKAVLQAEENLRVSKERYRSQLTTSTEVLDAQTLLTQARLNYYNSLYGYNLAEARLQRAMGER